MTCRATFQVGDLGVDFVYTGENGDAATWLPCVLLWNAIQADGGFTTEHLVPASIPEEGSQELTQEEAYGEDLAVFLPDPEALPLGFRFGGAHRKLEQNWDTLSVLFTRSYGYLYVQVRRFPEGSTLPQPDFQPEEVTASALEAWGSYGDDDLWDTPAWVYDAFSIHYPQADGSTIVVTWDVKGVSPADLAGLVTGSDVILPEGGPKVFPLE